MANEYELTYNQNSTYSEDDISGGGEQIASALYVNQLINETKAATDAGLMEARRLAQDAQVAADEAQKDATEATALLADLSNDNKITPVEKQNAQKEFDVIISENATINQQADYYELTTEKTTFNNAYDSLFDYLVPILVDLTETSDIVGADFRNMFKTYYDARTSLLKKISEIAKDKALLAQEKAETATNIAESKNRILLQPTDPPLNPSVGDMWIDTSFFPHTVYSWNGEQWARASVINPEEVGSYSIAEVDEHLSEVRIDVSGISERTSVVEEIIGDDEGLSSKIISSTTYQSDRDNAIEQRITSFEESINLGQYATQSDLQRTSDEIATKFKVGGGVNLIKNSSGYGGLLHWQVMSGSVSKYIGDDAVEVGAGFSIQTGSMKQAVSVSAGEMYTITAKVRKGTAGTAYMKISDGINFQRVDMIETQAYNYTPIQVAGFVPSTNTVIIEFGASNATGGCIFTAIMLNEGDVGQKWSHANGEVYTTGVSFDINGVQVNSSIYDGYTVMSPEEFSGYYRNSLGVMQKVFTLNKDVTEVAKLKVTDPKAEITMGSLKQVYVNGGGYTGWAFISS